MAVGLVIALAVLQGFTEFLPVSSSGHLRILGEVFGVADPQTLFDIVLHVGTLIPICAVYRHTLGRMTLASLRVLRRPGTLADEPDARLTLLVGLATIPTAALGLGIGHAMEDLSGDIAFVAAALTVNGFILLGLRTLVLRADAPDAPTPRGLDALTVRDALTIGTIQGFAIFRGISRSGSTITASMLCGLDRESAAAFSFLLAIPAILGALVLEFDASLITGDSLGTYLLGGAVAAVSGTVALLALLALLRRGHLHHFAWYCFLLAAATFAWRFVS